KGKRVLGFSSDDFHEERDLAQGWMMVRAESRTPEAIFAALKSGNFYNSTGVELTDIHREGDIITVESVDGQEIRIIGNYALLERVCDHSVSVDIRQWGAPYVRFEVYGRGAQMAWTQPFFMDI
ncbi:MAG: hypothetical protein ACOYET_05645, partial [Bacillota bacterium]